MPLSDKEKTEARDAIELALSLNEPETMLEGLKRLCVKKSIDAHISANERDRWRACADALIIVQAELESEGRLPKRDNGQESATSAPGDKQSDC